MNHQGTFRFVSAFLNGDDSDHRTLCHPAVYLQDRTRFDLKEMKFPVNLQDGDVLLVFHRMHIVLNYKFQRYGIWVDLATQLYGMAHISLKYL